MQLNKTHLFTQIGKVRVEYFDPEGEILQTVLKLEKVIFHAGFITEISHNCLMWNICGNALIWENPSKLC